MLRRLRRLGLRKTAVGLRPLCGFSPPHLCGCWKPAVSFIATAKTSYTAGRYAQWGPNLLKSIKKYTLRGKKNEKLLKLSIDKINY
jgi:hypothetical protein